MEMGGNSRTLKKPTQTQREYVKHHTEINPSPGSWCHEVAMPPTVSLCHPNKTDYHNRPFMYTKCLAHDHNGYNLHFSQLARLFEKLLKTVLKRATGGQFFITVEAGKSIAPFDR